MPLKMINDHLANPLPHITGWPRGLWMPPSRTMYSNIELNDTLKMNSQNLLIRSAHIELEFRSYRYKS